MNISKRNQSIERHTWRFMVKILEKTTFELPIGVGGKGCGRTGLAEIMSRIATLLPPKPQNGAWNDGHAGDRICYSTSTPWDGAV